MLNINQVQWAAGLIEGEGYFGFSRNTPVLKVGMTDKDVLEHLAALTGTKVYGPRQVKNYKPIYEVSIAGKRAAGWMMTLYTLMGQRRRERIRSVIAKWKAVQKPGRPVSLTCRRGHEYELSTTGQQHGRRFCRICQRARDNKWQREHRVLLAEKRRGRRRPPITE